MNRKVISLTSETINNVILKKPKITNRHSEESPEYISEIWYLDENKLHVPIIKTPRLKVKYTAKSWDVGTWSYCVNLYNYDIDPEINNFYNSIKEYDKYIVNLFAKSRKEWGLKGIKSKYWRNISEKYYNNHY